MRGFKKFRDAAVTLGGIELTRRSMKGRFDTSAVTASEGMRMSHLRDAVLPA